MTDDPFNINDLIGTPETVRGAGSGWSGEASAHASVSGEGLTLTGPPRAVLGAAGGCAVLGALVAVLGGSQVVWAVVGWVLAGPVAFALLGTFSNLDARARGRGTYLEPAWLRPVYWVVVAVTVVSVVIAALQVAEWVGHR